MVSDWRVRTHITGSGELKNIEECCNFVNNMQSHRGEKDVRLIWKWA